MEFKVKKNLLLESLSKFQSIAEKKASMPVLMNILLELKNDSLIISATNLEVSLIYKIDVQKVKEGKGTVHARNLFDIVKELDEEELVFKKEKNHWFSLKTKSSIYNIPGTKPEEFPVFPSIKEDKKQKIKSEVFLEAIQKTFYATSLDETRYHLSGVYFELGENTEIDSFLSVATDGHRMSLFKKNKEKKAEGIIVPKKGIFEIKKLLEEFKGEIFLINEKTQLIVEVEGFKLMVRLVDGKYPEYQNLIPTDLDKEVEIDTKSVLKTLKRVLVLVNKKTKGVGFYLSSNQLKIKTLNSETGFAEESLSCSYKGEAVEIGFNIRYLIDAIQNMDSDKIKLKFKNSVSPVTFTSLESPEHLSVVMPMRI